MDYQTLKKEISEIAGIAASVPEEFRQKCFELLLTRLLDGAEPRKKAKEDPPAAEEKARVDPPASPGAIPITSQIRVLMAKGGITADDLSKILFVEDGEVHFTKEPSHSIVARGQIEWALLIALRNGILSNNLSVDPEDVRSVCQDKGFYDKANFATNFKKEKSASFFKGKMEAQGESRSLTLEGQQELGKLIKALASAE